MSINGEELRQPEPVDRRRLVSRVGIDLLFLFLLMFVPAGTLAWARGWAFLAVLLGSTVALTIYLRRVNPELLSARINRHQGTKIWDKWLIGVFISIFLLVFPVAALDDHRYRWYPVPWWVCAAGYFFILAGFAGVGWAQSVNKFFEPTVRLQTDRGHRVVDTGPYAFVRHPGYVAFSFLFLGMPLALGSLWALIPAIALCLLLVVRTALEDGMLQKELPGYKEYAQRVRYRLLPGIW